MSCETILITGTTQGLGRELAHAFLAKGKRVIGCGRRESTIEHPLYTHAIVDLTLEKEVQKWVRCLKSEWGSLDALVCNAGSVKSSLYLSVTSGELYQSFVQSNLDSCFYICREISKWMVTKRQGRIITISSIMTGMHEPGTAIYSATKAALIELTKVLAKELASTGVTCNSISPSMIDTETSKSFGTEWRDRILAKQTIPLQLKAEDVAHVIEFLADKASWPITGQVIDMCYVR